MRFVPSETGLAPFDLAAKEFLALQTSGEPIEIEALHPRDMLEHRRIFALIGELAKALKRPAELVRAQLLFETGNFMLLGELFGKTVINVNSMSRHHMKDPELLAFWEEAKPIITEKMLPEITDAAERARLASSLSM
jgi:hypothetical protein